MSSLDTFFCLDAASHFYVDLRFLLFEIRRASHVRVEKPEVARMAQQLCDLKLLRRLRYHVDSQTYDEFSSNVEIGDDDWFEITPEGLTELDRLYFQDEEP